MPKASKARVVYFSQYELNIKTGLPLGFNEDSIKRGLNHKTIVQWAYICHDKDVYTSSEIPEFSKKLKEWRKDIQANSEEPDSIYYGKNFSELSDDEFIKSYFEIFGKSKLKHWHVVLKCSNALELSTYAKWFGVPVNAVCIAKGRGAFMDCVEYLTHEKQVDVGKYLYTDDCVKSNFDWRSDLAQRAILSARFGGSTEIDPILQVRSMILEGDLTLRQAREKYYSEYLVDFSTLRKLRAEYLRRCAPPELRLNYYISGAGGSGKTSAAEILARALFPDVDEDSLIFRVGAEGSTFEGYDGEPVIIWDDCRAVDLLKKLGGRGNLFTVFDVHPHKMNQNIKYSSVNLINKVNIVNSVQPFREFLDGLVGEYTDRSGVKYVAENGEKAQSYRRFPFIINLRAEDFDVLVNSGYLLGTTSYEYYYSVMGIRGNFGRLMAALGDKVGVMNVANGMLKPLLDYRARIEELQKKIPADYSEWAHQTFTIDDDISPLPPLEDEKRPLPPSMSFECCPSGDLPLGGQGV